MRAIIISVQHVVRSKVSRAFIGCLGQFYEKSGLLFFLLFSVGEVIKNNFWLIHYLLTCSAKAWRLNC